MSRGILDNISWVVLNNDIREFGFYPRGGLPVIRDSRIVSYILNLPVDLKTTAEGTIVFEYGPLNRTFRPEQLPTAGHVIGAIYTMFDDYYQEGVREIREDGGTPRPKNESLGDHIYFEGLTEDRAGVYSFDMGS